MPPQVVRPRRLTLTLPAALLLMLLLLALPGSGQAADTVVEVRASLGTVVTATLNLLNLGQPAVTVRLYEAWPPTGLASAAGPSEPRRVPLPASAAGARGGAAVVSPALLSEFSAAPDGQADMLIYLADQADLSPAAAIADWNRRGWAVMDTLRQHAARTQAPLLEALGAHGLSPRSYWIVNAVAVRGDRALAEALTGRPEVALVAPNTLHALPEAPPQADDPARRPAPGAVEAADVLAWGVERIGAGRVWAEWGVRGEGIVVANIDTGVEYSHTALLAGYRGWSLQGVSHAYNWYDAAATKDRSRIPFDLNGHGTHTLGTLTGGSADGLALGVAPGARWIAARGCTQDLCSDEALLAAAQWLLAPTDPDLQNPRPDLRPHVINNSWGSLGPDPWYTGYVEAWNAAGIFSTFAAGNSGGLLGCHSISNPGSYPAALSVGATDADDFIASFSSRGPDAYGTLKPDLSAPGVEIPSAWLDGSLRSLSGTSMATPHVAGAAALLWSANPTLIGNVLETRRILTATALPRASNECGGLPGGAANNVYGWGRLDAYRAVQAARVEVPWLSAPAQVELAANSIATVTLALDARQVPGPGQYSARLLVVRPGSQIYLPVMLNVEPLTGTARLTGRLVDRWTGQGVYGRLSLPDGPEVRTDAQGVYSLSLPAGTYSLTTHALGYLNLGALVTLGSDVQKDLLLTPDTPHAALTAVPLTASLPFGGVVTTTLRLRNQGVQPLVALADIPSLEWSLSGPVADPRLYDLSAFPPLPLEDDMVYTDALDVGFSLPFYGVRAERLYLSSNGWLSVNPPAVSQQFAFCLPSLRLPRGSLAPFWTDLDPSEGGTVRAGRVASDTFVVSYEAVPLWSETPSSSVPTYTFQVALHAGGQVEYLYGRMGDLPGRWSVGLGLSDTRGQGLGCHRAPLELARRGWAWLNQPEPAAWLSADPPLVVVLPGETQALTVTLRGQGYVGWRAEPFSGLVRLVTNDPLQPELLAPYAVKVGAPVSWLWAPLISR